ncbi:MAG: recombinase zinc beta ribbon domain-containing protein [Peptostreptococcaceae bacterium]|nr:recombinase zinc beta ribbon domain-containing protein [Peptostreptococcaceae bacterium]
MLMPEPANTPEHMVAFGQKYPKIPKNYKQYVGDALLQKTYTIDFLEKKRVINNEIVSQYYVENSHEAIIPRDLHMQVQEEIRRRANLYYSKNGSKRMYRSRYTLSSIVFCGECGDIYRRVHWNNRGKRSVVWRCVSRLEEKGSDCPSQTIAEEVLQTGVIKALNQIIDGRESFIPILAKNIETVLAAEICRLRGIKQETQEYKAQQQTKCQRISKMTEFLDMKSSTITKYNDKITRQLIEKITVL